MQYLKGTHLRAMLRSDDALDVVGGDNIDLSYPLIPGGHHKLNIAEATVAQNKKQTGNNLVLKWKNADEVLSTKGETLPPGRVVITQYVGLTVTEKRDAKAIQRDIERLRRATGINVTKLSEIRDNPSLLVGKTCLCKVKVRQETDEYPESNEVSTVVLEG